MPRSATVSHATYSQANTKAPKVANGGKVMKLTVMADRGAMMCIIRRGTLRLLNVKRQELVKVTERIVAAIGHQITLDRAVFLDLTAGRRKSVQMVYVSPARREAHAPLPDHLQRAGAGGQGVP